MRTVDLNCDMGEGFGVYKIGDDAAMLDIITSANVACGFHAGDPLVMDDTVVQAAARGMQIGAHPSFMDLWGFGRRPILGERPEDVTKQIIYQIGALQAIAASRGQRVKHVKTHGSLGNMAAEDPDLAEAVAKAIRAVDRDLIFLVMPQMATERAGEKFGLRMAREIYADRAYADNGNLLSRRLPDAVIHDASQAADRVLDMLDRGEIICHSGKRIPVSIDSICVHGDTFGAVQMAREIKRRLGDAGFTVAPMGA